MHTRGFLRITSDFNWILALGAAIAFTVEWWPSLVELSVRFPRKGRGSAAAVPPLAVACLLVHFPIFNRQIRDLLPELLPGVATDSFA